MPRIAFINPGREDYLGDSLFHGLRTVLGTNAVDYPKLDYAYDSYPSELHERLYGHGFSLYGLLPDPQIDRNRMLDRIVAGEFDLVVFSDIWSTFGLFTQIAPQLGRRVPMAVLDGHDRPEPYPYAGLWWRQRAWWTLPRAHRRAPYFKREITPLTGVFRAYLTLPPALAARLPSIQRMREISFSFPEEKIVTEPPTGKDRQFASHVVDPEVAARIGAQTSYAFSDEAEYYADLRRSRFGITTKRAGWDCLRHYEQAANGCVPCFRDLADKPPRCAPQGLGEDNCVAYGSADDLLARVEAIDEDRYRSLQAGAMRWARENSTRRRALQFLAACGLDAAA